MDFLLGFKSDKKLKLLCYFRQQCCEDLVEGVDELSQIEIIKSRLIYQRISSIDFEWIMQSKCIVYPWKCHHDFSSIVSNLPITFPYSPSLPHLHSRYFIVCCFFMGSGRTKGSERLKWFLSIPLLVTFLISFPWSFRLHRLRINYQRCHQLLKNQLATFHHRATRWSSTSSPFISSELRHPKISFHSFNDDAAAICIIDPFIHTINLNQRRNKRKTWSL